MPVHRASTEVAMMWAEVVTLGVPTVLLALAHTSPRATVEAPTAAV